MKEILDQYSPILEGKDIKDVKSTVKNRQKQLRLKGNEPLDKKEPQPIKPLKNITEPAIKNSSKPNSV